MVPLMRISRPVLFAGGYGIFDMQIRILSPPNTEGGVLTKYSYFGLIWPHDTHLIQFHVPALDMPGHVLAKL